MAKSSLTFSERRKVLTLGSNADHVVRTLTKQDCGKWIVLTNLQGHTITLPTAADAGEGWNCRFIVGTAHNDRSVRDTSSIAAQGSEVVSLVTSRNGGSLGGSGTAAAATALDFGSFANGDVFTMTVPVAAGGTGTTFTFTVVADDDAVNEAAQTATNFTLAKEGTDVQFAAAVKALIAGEADGANVTVKKPASGEGSEGTGIQGVVPTNGAGGDADKVIITAAAVGAAGDGIAFTEGVGDGIIQGATLGAIGGATAGANRTAFVLSTRTILITESVAEGDIVEVVVANGEWRARSASSL